MNHHTIARTPLGLAGAIMIVGMLAAPASARQDPGTGGSDTPAPGLPYSQDVYENHYLSPLPEAPAAAPAPRVVIRFIDDGSLEVLQVGAGLLAGIALTGAGMAAASRRNQGHVVSPA